MASSPLAAAAAAAAAAGAAVPSTGNSGANSSSRSFRIVAYPETFRGRLNTPLGSLRTKLMTTPSFPSGAADNDDARIDGRCVKLNCCKTFIIVL